MLVVALLSVLGGRWLDTTLGTNMIFTAIFLIVGAPVSIILSIFIMLRMARRAISDVAKSDSENKTIKS